MTRFFVVEAGASLTLIGLVLSNSSAMGVGGTVLAKDFAVLTMALCDVIGSVANRDGTAAQDNYNSLPLRRLPHAMLLRRQPQAPLLRADSHTMFTRLLGKRLAVQLPAKCTWRCSVLSFW